MNNTLLDVKELCSTDKQRKAYDELVKELGHEDLCFFISPTNRVQKKKLTKGFPPKGAASITNSLVHSK